MEEPKFKSRLAQLLPMDDVKRKVAVSGEIKLKDVPSEPASEGELQQVLFEGRKVRKVFHENEWFFSVVDVVEAITESPTPRRYWAELKRQLIEKEGLTQLFANIEQLKMEANDGKMRETDCANPETVLRLIQSIPSKKAEPFKRWLAKVGYERIKEFQDPEIAVKRAILNWQIQGRTNDWIEARLRSIVVRHELTDEWAARGINEPAEYGYLTNIISKETFGLKTEEHKRYKGLSSQNLRDHMTDMELVLTMLGEKSTTAIAQTTNAQGLTQNATAAHSGGRIAGDARRGLEKQLGRSVVSKDNFLKGKPSTQKKLPKE